MNAIGFVFLYFVVDRSLQFMEPEKDAAGVHLRVYLFADFIDFIAALPFDFPAQQNFKPFVNCVFNVCEKVEIGLFYFLCPFIKIKGPFCHFDLKPILVETQQEK